MEVKKVLWPTDFSANAAKALPYVQSLTDKYQAEVHVLYVAQEIAYHESWYGEFEEGHIEKIHDWAVKHAQKELDQVCDKYLKGCPMYIKHVETGDPAQQILKLIDQEKVDLVVMATAGKANFPFGSVSEKVVKNSPVPVVTIPTS